MSNKRHRLCAEKRKVIANVKQAGKARNEIAQAIGFSQGAEQVIAVSESVRNCILKISRNPMPPRSGIHRGVDLAEYPVGFTPSPEWLARWRPALPQLAERIPLLMPARLTRWKGQEDFIRLTAYDHGGVAEQLRAIFPQGLVKVGDLNCAIDRTGEILNRRPTPSWAEAFALERMLRSTLEVFQSVLKDPR